jgi:hypothetical protein
MERRKMGASIFLRSIFLPYGLGPRGIGVRGASASGTLTGVRSLCSRSGLVIQARKREVWDCPVLIQA